MRIAHLSDTHVRAAGAHHGVVDTMANVRAVLDRLHELAPCEVIVLSGDLSDDASVASYGRLFAAVDALAARWQARVVVVPGNHDVVAALAAAREGAQYPLVTWVGAVRFLALDTSVPGKGYGRVGRGQARRIQAELARPAPAGTVVVMHHPPLGAPTDLHRALALQDRAAVSQLWAGTDVRLVLCGHYHLPQVGWAGGAMVVVAPGVANRTDVAPQASERAVRGAGCAIVEYGDEPHVTFEMVAQADDGEEVFCYPPPVVERIAAAAGPG